MKMFFLGLLIFSIGWFLGQYYEFDGSETGQMVLSEKDALHNLKNSNKKSFVMEKIDLKSPLKEQPQQVVDNLIDQSVVADAKAWRDYQKTLEENKKNKQIKIEQTIKRREQLRKVLGENYFHSLEIKNEYGSRLGHWVRDPALFEEVKAENLPYDYTTEGSQSSIVHGSLNGKITLDGKRKTLVLKETPGQDSLVVTETSSAVFYEQDMQGVLETESYTSVVVNGVMSGTIVCGSYTDVILNGPFDGTIKEFSHNAIHFSETTLLSVPTGKIECEVGLQGVVSPSIYLHGTFLSTDLLDLISVVSKKGLSSEDKLSSVKVYFDQCELSSGEHMIAPNVKAIVK